VDSVATAGGLAMMTDYHRQSPQVVEAGSFYQGLILGKVMTFGESILSGAGVTRYFKSGNLYKENVQDKVITTINA
jgi:hypothetical protein